MRGVLLLKIVICGIFFEVTSAAPQCDMRTGIELDEGNMGQTSDFNWLGILQVFLNDDDGVQVAVSGIMLIKADRALASADDVMRIPKRIFQHDTRATFFPDGDIAVNYSLISYVAYPEYQTETFNSIAIILLNIYGDSPLVPICFPIISYDTSYLYLTGFTDENKRLEKMIHRIQYTNRSECEEFYEQEGLVVGNRQPISYLCGKGKSSRKRCVWDNGMALVSNSSGWFTLIGFSIHGPGCAAPARFISIFHYSAWIHDVTRNSDDEDDDYDYMSPDFRRNDGLDTEYIPIHRTFTALRENGADTEHLEGTDDDGATGAIGSLPTGAISKHEYMKWPFTVYKLDHFNVTPSAQGADVIWITPFNDTFEKPKHACANDKKQLLYGEQFFLTSTPGTYGTVTYKLSLYDLFLLHCTCVTLEVDCTNRTEAFLEFKEGFEYTDMSDPPPDKVLQVVVVTERGGKQKNEKDNPYLRPKFIESDKPYTKDQLSYDLFIRFTFKTKASLKFKMYSNEETPSRRLSKKKMKFPSKKMLYWGSFRRVDKNVKADPLVVDHEVVLDTVSEAWHTDVTPGLLIIGYLLNACSMRILFI